MIWECLHTTPENPINCINHFSCRSLFMHVIFCARNKSFHFIIHLFLSSFLKAQHTELTRSIRTGSYHVLLMFVKRMHSFDENLSRHFARAKREIYIIICLFILSWHCLFSFNNISFVLYVSKWLILLYVAMNFNFNTVYLTLISHQVLHLNKHHDIIKKTITIR